MANVAAPTSHFTGMPAHIWQSHPRSVSSSHLLHDDLPDHSAGAFSPVQTNPAVIPPMSASPEAVMWGARSSLQSLQQVDFANSSLPALPTLRSRSSRIAADPDPQSDANSLLTDIANIRIVDQVGITRGVSVVPSNPFHRDPISHAGQPVPHLTSTPPRDVDIDHRTGHQALYMPSSSQLMMSVHSSGLDTQSLGSLFAPSVVVGGDGLRSSPLLRQPAGPPAAPALAHMSTLSGSHGNLAVPRIKNELYKTEMCRSYQASSYCKYGSKCQFAHGKNEIRLVQRHPRYKTKPCRNFASTGSCPYGPRCRFIHNPDREPPQQSSPSATPAPIGVAPSPASVMARHGASGVQRLSSSEPGLGRSSGDSFIDDRHPHEHYNVDCNPATHYLDSLVESVSTDRGNGDLLVENSGSGNYVSGSVPAEHIYDANADVFHSRGQGSYWDSTVWERYGSENDLPYRGENYANSMNLPSLRYLDSASGPRDTVSGKSEDTHLFEPHPPSLSTQSLFSDPGAEHRATRAHTHVLSSSAASADFVNGFGSGSGDSAARGPSFAAGSRSRLPVFRNMSSDRDEQH